MAESQQTEVAAAILLSGDGPAPDAVGQAVPDISQSQAQPDLQDARRAEIEAKQELIGKLLTDAQADGLLMLDPANVAWLCGAALHQGVTDASEWPAVFLVPTQRWLVA